MCSRIDRAAFGNTDRHTMFTDAVVDVMNPGISDHSPLLLKYNLNMQRGGRPFKFFNYVPEHQDFMKIVKEGWS